MSFFDLSNLRKPCFFRTGKILRYFSRTYICTKVRAFAFYRLLMPALLSEKVFSISHRYPSDTKSHMGNKYDANIMRRGDMRCTMSRQNQLIGVFFQIVTLLAFSRLLFVHQCKKKVFYGIVPVKFTNSR